ncbi:MAG: hypothetical protein WC301_04675 [Candidatus Omnitrophota bacterium]|jgi:hypothetical protein
MVNLDIKRKLSAAMVLAFFLAFYAGTAGIVLAQGSSKDEAKRVNVIKEVNGEISWINKSNISVIFQRDDETGTESEMLLPLAPGIKIAHKRSISQLSRGDMVRVQYEEVIEETPEGGRTLISRKAKMITFLRAADKKPEQRPQDTKVLSSE